MFFSLFKTVFFTFFLLFPLYADEHNSSIDTSEAYPIQVWGDTIATVKEPFRDLSPKERAQMAEERILDIPPEQEHYDVKAFFTQEGNVSGAWITVNRRNVFSILEGDNDPSSNITFEQYTHNITDNLSAWLEKREHQHNWPNILKSIAFSTLATLVFALLFNILLRFAQRMTVKIESEGFGSALGFEVGGVNLRPYLTTLSIGFLKLIVWGLGLPLVYAWITFVFRQFPYTASWGVQLTEYLITLLSDFAEGTLEAIPGLIAVVVIFFITRLIIRASDAFFASVEQGHLEVSWMEPETARASRRVIVVLIWMFALVVAYPYIPGSQTEAFKGISVFLGLMLSLGSAGIVGQILGGIVVVYTRAFQTGDFVKIGEHEGIIREIGVLSTKIKTLRNEEITIPNAVLLSATTINYSLHAKKGEGSIITTSVTIGYDTPWRQVHAMLEMAAERTESILSDPQPVTLQKALSDFYVEYTLRFAIEKPEYRYRILSELHTHIQDVFNEYDVQIMSPHFEAQPDTKIWVPKDQWHTPPAKETHRVSSLAEAAD